MDHATQAFRPGPLSQALVALSRYTPLGRGGMRKLMAKAVRALNPQVPLDVSLYGGQARLHHTGNNSEVKALLSPNRYAREEYAFCRKHMPSEGGVFLDIGGNAGVFSLFVASLMQSGTLISDSPGLLTISLPESAGQASARLAEGVPTLDVPVIPMIDLLHRCGVDKLDLLKIDVEGFEDGVLFPFFAAATSDLLPKAIVMEACHSGRWERDCEAMLLEHGYKIVHKDRTNMMLILEP